MSALLESRTLSNTYNKMDNVLYEINDNKGLLRNCVYEPWKDEVLMDLLAAGFIMISEDKYVLTDEGREVINHDCFLFYNNKKLQKVTDDSPAEDGKFVTVNLGLLFFFAGFIVLALVWAI